MLEPLPAWRIGEFPERDGSMRQLREPDAVTFVQNGRLRLGVRRFTRTHDRVQILDNAKHVLFSTRSFEVPEGGSLSITVELRAEGTGCRAGDLYDAFASLLCLDLSTGHCDRRFLSRRHLRRSFRPPPLSRRKRARSGTVQVLGHLRREGPFVTRQPHVPDRDRAQSRRHHVDGRRGPASPPVAAPVPHRPPRPRVRADDREKHWSRWKRLVSWPGPRGGMGPDYRRAPPIRLGYDRAAMKHDTGRPLHERPAVDPSWRFFLGARPRPCHEPRGRV
jgi:hypothetical protein